MNIEQLRALAERLEKATGPDNELEWELLSALGISEGRPCGDGWQRCYIDGRYVLGIPPTCSEAPHVPESCRPWRITASIDAALALVERLGEDPEEIMREAMERLSRDGFTNWLKDIPLAILSVLVAALISRAEAPQ